MKRLLLAFVLMLLLPLGAQAVTTVPAHITEIQDEAFANTATDALILPETVERVGANILQGSHAAYILAYNPSIVFAENASTGVPFVFAPANSDAFVLPGYRSLENLYQSDGLYYFVLDTAEALCAVDPSGLTGVVTIPKLVDGVPVASIDSLYLEHTGVTELYVPQYLSIPEGLNATPYATMMVETPYTDVISHPAGQYITWTAVAFGSYGKVTYHWTFTCGEETVTQLTSKPTITYAPMQEGELVVSVTARDAIGDFATAEAAPITITPPETKYRALLIANTYPGASNSLPGPDNDSFAMLTMLNSMNGTPSSVRAAQNLTAGGIQAAIATTFADAQPSDVSLLYYSGHGSNDGALVGTNNTYLSVYGLRSALQRIPGTKIVILDCCYSGNVIERSAESQNDAAAFNRAVIQAFSSLNRSSENLADQGYIVLTACRKDQVSNTITDFVGRTYFGAFTYSLCYGSGYDEWQRKPLGYLPADSNGDGIIVLSEAISGIRERIAYLRQQIPALEQEMQYYGDENFILWAK